ncbi:hypothetical protein WG906_08905 [Pedobacter sp. P351]|uniref:hypothetical protein n=1 Tax=Pedobacter superstes TaxID=3133441 RepID=UPI00309BD60E
MDLTNFSKSEMPYKENYKTLYAWIVAKWVVLLIAILLVFEFLYFVNTANSSLEITIICIFLFALISNIPILYSFYKKTD